MSIAKVTEITASSTKGFEAAIQEGVQRASKTLDNIKSCWVQEMSVEVNNQMVTEYRVNMKVTFVLRD